jgi:hypothetical protein
MASPGLALSGFKNLDQELGAEYSSPLITPGPESIPAATEVQPLPVALPHDTVTLSTAGSQRATYQPTAFSSAVSVSGAAFDPPARTNRANSEALAARNSEGSHSSTTGGEATTTSTTKPSPHTPAAPRESDVALNDPYRAATQTTQQSLLQLDRTLQQIGVNPQHTSLIRRVALIRLANDPPALGEYFGPPPSVAPIAPGPATQTESAAKPSSTSRTTSENSIAEQDGTHQTFAPQGKRLNVSG